MKKIVSVLCIALIAAMMLLPSAALAASKGTIDTPSGKNANLRDVASLDDDESEVIGIVRNGSKVTILGSSGRFYKVEDNHGRTGYVHKTLVSTGSSSSSSSSSSTAKTGVTTAAVNLREGAGTSYDIIKVLPKGTKVTIVKRGDSWTKVKALGETGYISNAYFK